MQRYVASNERHGVLHDSSIRQQSELSRDEMQASVCVLMSKIAKYRPCIVCFLAKSIWEVFIKEAYRMSPSTPVQLSLELASGFKATALQCTRTRGASRFFQDTETKAASTTTAAKRKAGSDARRRPGKVPKYTFAFGLQPFKVVHATPTKGLCWYFYACDLFYNSEIDQVGRHLLRLRLKISGRPCSSWHRVPPRVLWHIRFVRPARSFTTAQCHLEIETPYSGGTK